MAMMHLAAYDVHEDQRRAQLSALLQAYGDRIQYSVFLLGITPEELVEIQSRAAGIIDENTDSLCIGEQIVNARAATFCNAAHNASVDD